MLPVLPGRAVVSLPVANMPTSHLWRGKASPVARSLMANRNSELADLFPAIGIARSWPAERRQRCFGNSAGSDIPAGGQRPHARRTGSVPGDSPAGFANCVDAVACGSPCHRLRDAQGTHLERFVSAAVFTAKPSSQSGRCEWSGHRTARA
jgi:hypothetical protein